MGSGRNKIFCNTRDKSRLVISMTLRSPFSYLVCNNFQDSAFTEVDDSMMVVIDTAPSALLNMV